MPETTPNLAVRGPGFRTFTAWTVLFMVGLRIAIGWHFFYEGLWKLMEPDWTATGYLVASAGPLRPIFTGMVKDPDGLERMTPESILRRIDERYAKLVRHYGITDEQRRDRTEGGKTVPGLDAFVEARKAEAAKVFEDPDFIRQKADYEKFLGEIRAMEASGNWPPYDLERWQAAQRKKSQARADLLARVEAPLRAIDAQINAVLDPKTQLSRGKPRPDASQTEWIDWANMIALTAVGACLMLGLFTRLACLGAAGLLAMYYLAMPPWPGLPQAPDAEGHYLIVNKNLIELVAVLMIATTRIGCWAGLDAFLSALCRRRKCLRQPVAPGEEAPAQVGQSQ